MLEWRLEAFRRWQTMEEPTWARVDYPKIDYQDLYYYSAPKKKELASLDEVDPEILKTYEKLGIPLREQEMLAGVVRPEGERRVAVDAVFDSVSVATTFQAELKKAGVIFMPISEAIREHPELVKKYLGTVVPTLTTILRRSTRRCSPTARSSTCRKAFAARWSCRRISASTSATPASSSAR
jgi:Fe-S cluster assembly protein SufB